MGKVSGENRKVKRKKHQRDLDKLHSNVLAAKAALDGKIRNLGKGKLMPKRKKICDRLLPRPENWIHKYGTKGVEIKRNPVAKEPRDKTNKNHDKSDVLKFLNSPSNSSRTRCSENSAKGEEEHCVNATPQEFVETAKPQITPTPFSKLFEEDTTFLKNATEDSQKSDTRSSYVIYREFCRVVSHRSFKMNIFGIVQAIKNNIKQFYNQNYKKRVSNKRWADEWSKSLPGNFIEVQACTDTDATEISKRQSENQQEENVPESDTPKINVSKKETHRKYVSSPFQRFTENREKEYTSLQVNYDPNSVPTDETELPTRTDREYPMNRILRADDFYPKHCKHVPTILRRNQQHPEVKPSQRNFFDPLPSLIGNQLELDNLVEESVDSGNISTPSQCLNDNSNFFQFKSKYMRSKYCDNDTSDAASRNFPFCKRSLHFSNTVCPESDYEVYQQQKGMPFIEQPRDRNTFCSNLATKNGFPRREICKDSRQQREFPQNSRKFPERRFKNETLSQPQLSTVGRSFLDGAFNGRLEPEKTRKKVGTCHKEKKTYKPVQLIGYLEETQSCDCGNEDKRRVEEESLQKAVQNLRTLNFNDTQNPSRGDFGRDCIQQPIKFVALEDSEEMQLRVPVYLQQKPKETVNVGEFLLLQNYQRHHPKVKDEAIRVDDFPVLPQKGAKRADFSKRNALKLDDRLGPIKRHVCECHKLTGRVCLGEDRFESEYEPDKNPVRDCNFNKWPRGQKTTRRNGTDNSDLFLSQQIGCKDSDGQGNGRHDAFYENKCCAARRHDKYPKDYAD